ncbi:MAG: aromatic amino acid transport family protein [Nanoarchaeota archaeon]
MNKKFWATAFTLSGTIIGAGILGLPYVISQSGFIIGLFWILFFGLILGYIYLCLGEISLRTKENHQLTGYAQKYLGNSGKILMFMAMLIGIYSALLAYLMAEGESLSLLLVGSSNYALLFGILFWIVLTLILGKGLRELKRVETGGILAIILIIVSIFFYLIPNIKLTNLLYIQNENFFLPIGVILFSLLGFTSISELRIEIRGDERNFKNAIIAGIIIPIILYIIFSLACIGTIGKDIQEIATLSFGPLARLLGIFTMFSAYLIHSFSLKDMFKFDFNYSEKKIFIFVSIMPLIIYFLCSYFRLFSFISILGMGGVLAGGINGILIPVINLKSKKLSERKPEYQMPMNWIIIFFISLIFILGVLFEIII